MYTSDSLPTFFAIDDPVPVTDVQGIKKDSRGGFEADPMFESVAAVLRLIPGKSHSYIQYCIYGSAFNPGKERIVIFRVPE